ncbi:endonuclease domain-containing protein [Rubrivirga sp. IMCC43871]|uniref:endonuclease domain-containing protein n=1 Tax=Rubrivirga sp. IMCC43871 TaxID=3391575 RepID=UPI00398FAF2A
MPRLHNRPDLRANRRASRTQPTTAEATLWKVLRRRRLHDRRFRRQRSIGSYVLDFYCPAERLAIEVDGGIHHDPARAAYDSTRQRWLEDQGLRVVRYSNEEVLSHVDLVLAAIAASFLTPALSPEATAGECVSLPPRRGGRAGEGGVFTDRATRAEAPLPPAPSPRKRREGENESGATP